MSASGRERTPGEELPNEPVIAAVALGSNLGDRRAQLDAAVRAIAGLARVRVLAVSSWIETAPVGGPSGQGPYLNGALLLRTTLSSRGLLRALLGIERAAGRERVEGVRNGPRTLDLDLLVFGGERRDESDLVLPHPRLAERAFVLEPLCEIAPDLVVPLRTGARRVDELRSAVSGRARASTAR